MEARKSCDAMVWAVLRRAADGVCDGREETEDWDATRFAKSNIAIHCRDGMFVKNSENRKILF